MLPQSGPIVHKRRRPPLVYITTVTESDKLCIFPWVFFGAEICSNRPLDSPSGRIFFLFEFVGIFLKKGLISRGKYGIICFCIKGILCPEVNFREQEV